MSANQPTSFRFPFTLDKSVHPTVHTAVRYVFSGLLDLQNASAALNTKLGDAVTSLTNQIKAATTPAPAAPGAPKTGGVSDVTASPARAGTLYTTRATDHQGLIVANGGTVTLSSGVPKPFVTRIVNTGGSPTIVTPDQARPTESTGIQSINGNQNYSLGPGQAQNFYFNTADSNWTAA